MPFEPYGGSAQPEWDWANHAGWYESELGKPDVLLRQVGPNLFQLAEGFRYRMPDEANTYWDISRHNPAQAFPNNSTDLASVPSWLWWFVASYGRHSHAALMHDDIIDRDDVSDRDADTAFRMALRDSKVPILRRWLMWDAVSLASMWRTATGKLGVLAFALNLLAFVGGLAAAIYASWGSLRGMLAWPFVQLWSVATWIWTTLLSSPAERLWSSLDIALPSSLDGNPWWRTFVVGMIGLLIWRKRWLISLAGLLLILLPTLTVFGSRAVAFVLEEVLYRISQLPGVQTPSIEPTFGDPFRQQGGPI